MPFLQKLPSGQVEMFRLSKLCWSYVGDLDGDDLTLLISFMFDHRVKEVMGQQNSCKILTSDHAFYAQCTK